jgi:aryl-alcohol dehydrogenase-like predicted oxidoreductase
MYSKSVFWRGENIPRYILGTAQIGLDYGISNVAGKPDYATSFSIIKTGYSEGIRFFDTAQAYGNSEIILGHIFQELGVVNNVYIISKLSKDQDLDNYENILHSINCSLKNLGVNQLWGLLLHDPQCLSMIDTKIWNYFISLKNLGVMKYFGISVYTPKEVEEAILNPYIDIIQAPCNLWDIDILNNNLFRLAERYQKLIFIRSIFLQGLLFMEPKMVSKRLPIAEKAAEEWEKIISDYGIDRHQVCMRFAQALNCPIIIGVDNGQQVIKNSFYHYPPLSREEIEILNLKIKPYLNPNIIDPRRWENDTKR